MQSDEQFGKIVKYLESLEPTTRLTVTVKLYFAYFLTIDELHRVYDKFQEDFRHPASDTLYKATFDWFQKYSPIEVTEFNQLLDAPRPFIWSHETLKEEFKDLLELTGTVWVTYDEIDYSNGRRIGDSPLHEIEWFEERGMVEVDGMLVSRSIQPVLMGDVPSEKIVVAMEAVPQERFTSTFEIIPALGGGCAFKGVYGPAQLSINYADAVGIDDVDSAMLCVGRIVVGDDKTVSVEELPKFDYFKVERTLHNGVKVPFIV